MSEPTTPGTPTSDEATALALLDNRGRQAATSLHTAVDRLVAEVPPPAGGDVAVVGLHPAALRRGQGRTWLIAAAVLVVAGLVAAIGLVLQADDEEGIVSEEGPGYLVPGRLPDGWELQEARELDPSDAPDAFTGTITVYGDPAVDDPWTGPKLSVWRGTDDGLGLDEGDDVEEIEVGGLPATIEDGGGSIRVRVLNGDATVLVLADRIERSVVLAAAEAAVAGDDDGARPRGFEQLASGPLSAAIMGGGYAVDGLSLLYGGSSSADGQLIVIQQAGDRDDAELARLSSETETIEVRGLPAYLVDGTLLQWYEPSAQVVVTVMGNELDDPSLLEQFAAGLQAARPGQVEDLVRAYGGSGPAGRLQPGEVLVAEGEYADGQPWQLVASDDGTGGFGLTFSDGAGGTGTGVEKDGGWGTLDIGVADHQSGGQGGEIGIYGAVTPQAAELVVEAPGHEPIRLPLHTVEGIAGWDEKVFAGVVPTDLGPAEAVALAADGSELARVPFEVDAGMSSGGSIGDTTPGGERTTGSTCRTLPDGGEECSAASSGSG